MPNGEITLFVNSENKKTIVPLELFKSELEVEMHTEPALELLLWNSWGPVLDVKNIGLDNIYLKRIIAPDSATFAHDGEIVIQKAGNDAVFQVNMLVNNILIKNISKSMAEIVKPVHRGETISVDLESTLVNCEGQIIVSISIPDDWINEEWNPDNEW